MNVADGELQVPAEQIEKLIAAIEKVERRRRIMVWGYLLAAVVLVVGQIFAFVAVARSPRGTFMGWVYLAPFALVGAILWGFGKWSGERKK